MPISYGSFERQIKLLPLVMHADGRMNVTVRCGYVENQIFNPMSEETYVIAADTVSTLLDMQPQAGMSRRDDLAYALYSLLVTSNLLKPGTIT